MALLVASAHSSYANLITNGDFELPAVTTGTFNILTSSQLTGWTISNQIGLTSTTYAENGATNSIQNYMNAFNAQSGNQSVDLTGDHNQGPTDGIQQIISTIAGGQYRMTFWVGNAYNGGLPYPGIAIVDVQIGGVDFGDFTNTDTSLGYVNWRQFSIDFSAASTETLIAFYNATPPYFAPGIENNWSGLDNVAVNSVPGPIVGGGVPGMVLASGGLLAWWRRRRLFRVDPLPEHAKSTWTASHR